MAYCPNCKRNHNVGFISTRLAGTDGVSLETAKWADVFEKVGFSSYYFAGELDRPPECSFLIEEAQDRARDLDEGLHKFWQKFQGQDTIDSIELEADGEKQVAVHANHIENLTIRNEGKLLEDGEG